MEMCELYDSLCAIGIATVKKAVITDKIVYLTRPREIGVSVINQQIQKRSPTGCIRP